MVVGQFDGRFVAGRMCLRLRVPRGQSFAALTVEGLHPCDEEVPGRCRQAGTYVLWKSEQRCAYMISLKVSTSTDDPFCLEGRIICSLR